MKYLSTLAGIALTLLCFWYLALQVGNHWQAIDSFDIGALSWGQLATAMLVYLVSAFAAFNCWHQCLKGLGGSLALIRALPIAFMSQVAKYVPGNVAHHLGKVYLTHRTGITVKKATVSILCETALTALAASTVFFLVLLFEPALSAFFLEATGLTSDRAASIVGWVVPVGGGLALLGGYLAYRRKLHLKVIPTGFSGYAFSRAFAAQLLSCLLLGLTFVVAAQALGIETGVTPTLMGGMFVLAWLLGFVMPGAPGGLGVREALLVTFFTPFMGAEGILILSAVHRLLTVLGDGLLYLIGLTIKRLGR